MLVGSEAIARERSASGGRRGSRLGDGKGHGKERDKGGNRSERRSPPMTALPTKTRAHQHGVGNTLSELPLRVITECLLPVAIDWSRINNCGYFL